MEEKFSAAAHSQQNINLLRNCYSHQEQHLQCNSSCCGLTSSGREDSYTKAKFTKSLNEESFGTAFRDGVNCLLRPEVQNVS
jgi:hypothetical protein